MNDKAWAKYVATTSLQGLGEDPNWFIEHDPSVWLGKLQCDRSTAVVIAIAIVDLVLPQWKKNHPKDTGPVRAIDYARSNPIVDDSDLTRHVRALAKACAEARKRSMGYYHRIAEAAGAVANATCASTGSASIEMASRALAKTEEHILYLFAVDAQYGKKEEVRRDMLAALVNALQAQSPN